ncbi:Smr domain-containing protein [Termitomyces sp. T112]|nr:Smr domain-containing protein [Termitomyces sp. T112]
MNSLFETLQGEFCPPLDSSLLAALLADLETDGQGNTIVPSSGQIEELKNTLRELSSQADESQLNELSDLHLASNTDDTNSTPEFYQGTTTSSSDSSESSQQPFSSPLGFLQAALPHIPTATLRSALDGTDGDDIDMWDIVADILTIEIIREMEERGLDGLDEELGHVLNEREISWETVERKKKPEKVEKRRNTRGKTVSLVDVRQRQHTPKRMNANVSRPAAAPDPWTQLSSLSTHLATLLPPHSPSFFQSYFHSPEHATPYIALHACLRSICNSQPGIPADEYKDILSNLLEIISPEYEGLDDEAHMHLLSDLEVSLQATSGRGDDALDLAKLLRDLDSDSTGYLKMGVYHSAPQSSKARQIRRPNLPTGPPPIPPPPQLRPSAKPPPPSTKSSSFQWQTVPQRRPVTQSPHPLAANIPAYASKVAGNTFGKGGKGDVGEPNVHKRRMEESIRKRNELLKQATKMWQKGNSKTRGGEVAFYFAERAREFQELAQMEAVNAARTMVESRRTTSGDPYSVDLHGTTAYEAIIIVKDILQTLPTSQSKPLRIITGRGSHSVNQVSVLKPAIKKALLEDNWLVGTWDGGLVVRGKR